MNSKPIGIFDSGIGGLTVLKELQNQMPNENFIYFGDTLNFPYGEKTKEEIINFSKKNIEYLLSQDVKMIVIACGTATSQAIDIMQNIFDIPIVGIIEPTVNYIEKMNLNKVGVIATTGTITSGAWERNIKQKINDIEVINKACPLLAGIAEEGEATSNKSLKAIHEYMQIFKENNVKTIILGCTHYPIYDEIIKKEFSYKVNLINTGVAVAKEIEKYLNENNMKNKGKKKKIKIIISKEEKDFDKKTKNILKSVKKLDITKFY